MKVKGSYQNNVAELSNLTSYDYEQIFKLYKDSSNSSYFYNILKTVNIPNVISEDLYFIYAVKPKEPLTAMSYTHYKTIKLWWLICSVNQIFNPVAYVEPGTLLKIPYPRYVMGIINTIKQSLVD